MSRLRQLSRTQLIHRPLPEVFAFFADASNLDALTPPFLNFRILTPMPIEIRTGSQLDYRLSLFGLPFRWRTRITDWQPNARFVDEQESGPYALWRHTHEFEARGNTTLMRDVVDYAEPLGPLGAVAHHLFIRRTLERIFDYRRDAVTRLWSTRPTRTRMSTTRRAAMQTSPNANHHGEKPQGSSPDFAIEVFYDGACPLCVREMRMLQRRDRKGRIRFVDITAKGFEAASIGLTWEALMARIHGRLPDGTIIEGVEVFRRLYAEIGFGPVVTLSRLPGIRQALDVAYATFAKNRLRLTGRCDDEACEVHPKPGTLSADLR